MSLKQILMYACIAICVANYSNVYSASINTDLVKFWNSNDELEEKQANDLEEEQANDPEEEQADNLKQEQADKQQVKQNISVIDTEEYFKKWGGFSCSFL